MLEYWIKFVLGEKFSIKGRDASFTNCHSHHFLSMIFWCNFWSSFCCCTWKFQVHCWPISRLFPFSLWMQFLCNITKDHASQLNFRSAYNSNFPLFKSFLFCVWKHNEIPTLGNEWDREAIVKCITKIEAESHSWTSMKRKLRTSTTYRFCKNIIYRKFSKRWMICTGKESIKTSLGDLEIRVNVVWQIYLLSFFCSFFSL